MARFGATKRPTVSVGLLVSLLLLAVVIGLFLFGSNALRSTQSDRQKEILSSSVDRSITQCYALEGSYPSSLSYLEEHYGLTYDKDRYYIDYQFIGSNLRPDITIIERTY